METRQIGKSGLSASLIGLGCNNFGVQLDRTKSRPVIEKALELGINFFDTANIYGNPKGESESILGEILGSRRKDVVIATKSGKAMDANGALKGSSRSTILRAVEDSLRRLKTDWIDLLYMHDPDPRTPIEETLRTLDDLVRAGKVRYIGCSNFSAWQVADAAWTASQCSLNRFICCQSEYNLLARAPEQELLPALDRFGLGLVPYFPLASGLLTGKYKRDAMPKGARLTEMAWFANYQLSPANWRKIERLEKFCSDHGRAMIELALGWLAANPAISSIITGATRPEQLEQNFVATGWKLTADEMKQVDELLKV